MHCTEILFVWGLWTETEALLEIFKCLETHPWPNTFKKHSWCSCFCPRCWVPSGSFSLDATFIFSARVWFLNLFYFKFWQYVVSVCDGHIHCLSSWIGESSVTFHLSVTCPQTIKTCWIMHEFEFVFFRRRGVYERIKSLQ